MAINREKTAMLAVLGLAACACVIGLVDPPSETPHITARQQAFDLFRALSTTALAIALLLGPGIALRISRPRRRLRLALLPLPGLALLILTGGLTWLLANAIDPQTVSVAVLAPVLCWQLACLLRAGPEQILDREERWVLLVVGSVLGIAIARAIWSGGPDGELYSGTVSRTLEVGDRSDSRISYHLSQLIAFGLGPYGEQGSSYFFPYSFSSRGPLPGLASAPFVFAAGGQPPPGLPENPWQPFDAQGFMAYRIAMMTFACTAFVALWELTRRLGGDGAARVALLLAATTPFLVHEVWFTWPKLLAAYLVLLAVLSLVRGNPFWAGLAIGVGYLMHPGALLALAPLGLIALWPLTGAVWRSPRWRQALLLLAGVAACLVVWRLANGSHYSQGDFVNYFTSAGADFDPSPGTWLLFRLQSLGNTVVPLMLFLFYGGEDAINVFGGTSPGVIHFFFQYWNGIPFGVGILFFPLLLISLWHAWLRWRWATFVTVVVPLLSFAVYWGSSLTGMLREGLQFWVLALLALVAMQQREAGFPWLRSRPIRALLSLRAGEILVIALVPTLATGGTLISDSYAFSDLIALLAMAGFAGVLGVSCWRLSGESRTP